LTPDVSEILPDSTSIRYAKREVSYVKVLPATIEGENSVFGYGYSTEQFARR
jgi:hypothetical protein